MKEIIKYNTDKCKVINFDTFYDIDFSYIKYIQFKSKSAIGNVQNNIYTDYDNYCTINNNNTIFINEERYKDDFKIILSPMEILSSISDFEYPVSISSSSTSGILSLSAFSLR